jgi:hypothetical protein
MSYARTFDNGSLLLTRPSISTLRPMLTKRVRQRGAPKGAPSQVGKHLALCYGFTENVHISSLLGSHLSLTTSRVDSWLWEEYSQVRYPPSLQLRPKRTYMIDKLRDHPGHQIHVQCRLCLFSLFLLRFQGHNKTRLPRSIIIISCTTLKSI